MSVLAGLKLVAAKRPNQISPIQLRRDRMVAKLDEQIALATALLEGKTASFTRIRRVKDDATGIVESKPMPKRVRACWWKADGGKLCFTVRYGGKELELAKGKAAVEVAGAKELVAALEVVKRAAVTGELDAQLDAASANARSAFKKS